MQNPILFPRKAGAQIPPSPVLSSRHLMATLGDLSASLRGDPTPRVEQDDKGVPTPESLASAAADLDLDVRPVVRKLSGIERRDLPCVALLKSGSSLLLADIARPGVFVIEVDGNRREISIADLDADYAGTIFSVRQRPPATEPETAPHGHATKAKAGIVRRILDRMLETQQPILRQLAIAALLSNLLMLALPLFTMAVYDRVIPHLAMETLWALGLGVVLALVVDLSIRLTRLKLVDAVAMESAMSLQASLMRSLLQSEMSKAPRTAGGIANHLKDIDIAAQSIPQLLVAVFVDLPFFVLVLVLIAAIAGPVVFAPILGALALVLVYFVGNRAGREASVRGAELQRIQSNMLIESVSSLEAVKATTAERRLLERFERVADDTAIATHESRMWAALGSQASYFISQAVVVLIVIIAVYEISVGQMTVGALAASTLLGSRALTPLASAAAVLDRLVHVFHGAGSLERVLATPQETTGDPARNVSRAIKGRIALRNVDFTYPDETNPVLQGVSFTIEPGERVAIIGRVGCGKSTLLRLLTRLVAPVRGTIQIDDHDIRQYAPRTLRRSLGLATQEAVLFDAPLRANILAGLDRASSEAFERAVTISGVKEFASRHPKGYDMLVGPRGERLSGGERQAVAMARTLLIDPAVLLLDEPTASLDTTAEAKLVRELQAALQGKTLIIATHRAAVLSLVDRVIWLEGGRVMADGPRDEVMAKLTGVPKPARA